MNDSVIKSKRIKSHDLGMPAAFWGRIEKKEPKTYVRIFKNGACIDAFNCEQNKVEETVLSKYGKEVTYKI